MTMSKWKCSLHLYQRLMQELDAKKIKQSYANKMSEEKCLSKLIVNPLNGLPNNKKFLHASVVSFNKRSQLIYLMMKSHICFVLSIINSDN